MGAPSEMRHHGIKGMHWGRRKAAPASSSAPAPPTKAAAKPAAKPTTQQIHEARVKQLLREQKLNGLAADVHLARTQKGRQEAAALLQKHADVYANGKDAQVAAKMTTGEKWAAGVSWAAMGAVAAGYIAVNVAAKKH